MKDHIHTQDGPCCCWPLALEPHEQCLVHGHPWPPRCTECGQMMPWSNDDTLTPHEAQR